MKLPAAFSLFLLLTLPFASLAQRNAQRDLANAQAAYEALNRRDYPAFIALCDPQFTEYTADPRPSPVRPNAWRRTNSFSPRSPT